VTVAASGPQAAEALEKVRELVTSGFGEMGDEVSPFPDLRAQP
jgi:hypothetical protein